MSVYEKLVQARLKFQSADVKKSGKNTYAGYTYFELSDILPICNKICEEVKAVCVVSFNDTIATLEFIDCEKPEEKITFTSPMSQATLKGCHAVQNLGAVETYIKRYLYQNCFEIAESDSLDGTMNPQGQAQAPKQASYQKKNVPTWTKAQLAELGKVLDSKYSNGEPIFLQKDRDVFNNMYSQNVDFNSALKQAKDIKSTRLRTLEGDNSSTTTEQTPNVPEDVF